jgi:UDPglucose 6-dehydrogenase
MADTPYSMAEGCDLLMINTEWNEFRQLDLKRIRDAMKTPLLFDGRNIYDPEKMVQLGFRYRGVGRGYNGD